MPRSPCEATAVQALLWTPTVPWASRQEPLCLGPGFPWVSSWAFPGHLCGRQSRCPALLWQLGQSDVFSPDFFGGGGVLNPGSPHLLGARCTAGCSPPWVLSLDKGSPWSSSSTASALWRPAPPQLLLPSPPGPEVCRSLLLATVLFWGSWPTVPFERLFSPIPSGRAPLPLKICSGRTCSCSTPPRGLPRRPSPSSSGLPWDPL